MLILSLDSAGTGCSVCVWRDGRFLAHTEERMERGQDQRLMPLVLDVMTKAGVTFDAIDRIAVTRGPGSFTGLRIGLAAARGLGFASDKPVIGIDRFSIFHEQFRDTGKNLLIVIDSRRKELFCRFYPVNGSPTDPAMMTAEEIRDFLKDKPDTIITGDAVAPELDIQKPLQRETITAAILAANADIKDPAFLPRPLYIRAPDVTVKKPALQFQPVTTAHAAQLAEIHAASFGAAAWKLKQMEGSLALATTQGWAASENGKIVGFILCQVVAGEHEILTFAVLPEAQRRGVGEKLLRKSMDTLRTGKIFLEVAADNEAARRLYEKLGFKASGTRPDYYRREGSGVDAAMYERILSEQ